MAPPKYILIIDDETAIRELLAEALTMAGFRVGQAASASAARKLLAAELPDLLITDLQLEQSDGLTFVSEIKSAHPHLPALLLTGVLFDEEAVERQLLGKVSAYLPKTAPLKSIIAEARRLVGG